MGESQLWFVFIKVLNGCQPFWNEVSSKEKFGAEFQLLLDGRLDDSRAVMADAII